MNLWGQAELERRLANLIRIGVIQETNHADKKLRVAMGATQTAWLPWPAEIGNNFVKWRPLRVGQQVIVIAPSGELNQAVIVGQLYGGGIEAPSTDEQKDLIQFEDGTQIEYDSAAHRLTAKIKDTKIAADQTSIQLKNGASRLNLTAEALKLESHGSSVELDATGVKIKGVRVELN
jgi:phage baseplate assembly protein V